MVEYKINPDNDNPKVEGQAKMILAATVADEGFDIKIFGSATGIEMAEALGKLVAFAAEATHAGSRFVEEVMTEATFAIADIKAEGDE